MNKAGFWEVPERDKARAANLNSASSQNEKRTTDWLRREVLVDSKAPQVPREKATKE